MGIYRSNNPLDYDKVDGVLIDESAPPASIKAAGANTAILVGQFERGPANTLTDIVSTKRLNEQFGENYDYEGRVALLNKKFNTLKLIKVEASDAVLATKTFLATAVSIITFAAKGKGVYGNGIKVTIEAGTIEGSKYTVQDTKEDAEYADEVYDDVVIDEIDADTFALSNLVDVTVEATSSEPDTTAATALASGSDGTVADTDYETAIAVAGADDAGDVLFLDAYTETRNGYLKTHTGTYPDKMAIMAGAETDSVSTAVSAVASLRDTDGRLIYAFNWVKTTVEGIATFVSPASFIASLISLTSPHVSIAYAGNTGFLFGISAVKNLLTRAEFISLMDAGICSFEFDKDIGFKVKSAVVTQIANSSKVTILRRRMADWLTNSIAVFLKNYQDAVNSLDNRLTVKGSMLSWIERQETLEILPKDSEVSGGFAKLVDIESLNDNDSIAAGQFIIKYKQRIFSSMRFIVLRAEIGESVVVTEVD